jgi:hypothetical protein
MEMEMEGGGRKRDCIARSAPLFALGIHRRDRPLPFALSFSLSLFSFRLMCTFYTFAWECNAVIAGAPRKSGVATSPPPPLWFFFPFIVSVLSFVFRALL